MTPQISPATSPIVEVSEDEEGAEDTDYVADLQAAQSTWGGGQASTAQEPQPQPETIPRTSPVTTPVLEVSKEEDGAADIGYVVDLQATQSTWDPWPTTAQDIPQPAQDAPSSPQDEPTAVYEEP